VAELDLLARDPGDEERELVDRRKRQCGNDHNERNGC
jgi:hypothetical protein